MLKIHHYFKISRPRFWIYLFGTFLVGLIAGANSLEDIVSWQAVLLGLYFLLPANLLIYGVNDIFDWETDKHNNKKKAYEALVQPKTHKQLWLTILALNFPVLALLPFLSTSSILAMLGFWFFGIFYSAKPIRAKAIPFIDSFFNVLYVFPGLIALYLTGTPSNHWIPFIAACLWVMAMHAYSAVPDITADERANVKTVATVLGKQSTLLVCLALYITSGILGTLSTGPIIILFTIPYILLMLFSLQTKNSQRLFSLYKLFPSVNTIVGAALFFLALRELL